MREKKEREEEEENGVKIILETFEITQNIERKMQYNVPLTSEEFTFSVYLIFFQRKILH